MFLAGPRLAEYGVVVTASSCYYMFAFTESRVGMPSKTAVKTFILLEF